MIERKNSRIFFISGGIFFLLAIMTGGEFFYYIFLLHGIIFLVIYLGYQLTKDSIDFYYVIPEKSILSGDPFKVIYRLTNESPLPLFNFQTKFYIKNQYSKIEVPMNVEYLTPFQSKRSTFTMDMDASGLFNKIEIQHIYSDFLSIFERKEVRREGISIFIYPKVHNLESLKFIKNYEDLSLHNSIYEDYSDLERIREYQPTDNIKKIHWKLSAKQNKYMVKEYEKTSEKEFLFIVDGFGEDYNKFKSYKSLEGIKELTVSLIKYCLDRNFGIKLIYETDGYNEIYCKDSSEYKNILKNIATFNPIGETPFEEFLGQVFIETQLKSFVTIITLNLNKALVDAIMLGKDKDSQIILIHIRETQEEQTIEKSKYQEILKASGIIYYPFDVSDGVEWFNGFNT